MGRVQKAYPTSLPYSQRIKHALIKSTVTTSIELYITSSSGAHRFFTSFKLRRIIISPIGHICQKLTVPEGLVPVDHALQQTPIDLTMKSKGLFASIQLLRRNRLIKAWKRLININMKMSLYKVKLFGKIVVALKNCAS